jgi:hypothetical protein
MADVLSFESLVGCHIFRELWFFKGRGPSFTSPGTTKDLLGMLGDVMLLKEGSNMVTTL